MNILEKDNGEILTNQKDILEEVKQFYEGLYTERQVRDVNLDELLKDAHDIPKVSDFENNFMESNVSLGEAKEVLKNMKNNKSPGPDGFTVEFYKFFFSDIGAFLVRSINYGLLHEHLSVTQCQGLITCIPKEDKLMIFKELEAYIATECFI
jgi:hypothetical protein